jgi:hypothetical protein
LESGGAASVEDKMEMEMEMKKVHVANAGWTSPARECASPASFTPPRIRTPRPPRPRVSPLIRSVLPSSSSSSALPVISSSTPLPFLSAHQHHTHTSSPLAISASLPALDTTSSSSSLPAPSTDARTPVRRTLSAPAALAYVAARRPAADVNWGFRAQLREWEGVCRAGTASL